MIKKGLKVKILAGKDKKKEGEIIEIDRPNNRAKVKEINMVKRHVKTTKEKKGGIISKESFIHLSNLKLIDEKIKKPLADELLFGKLKSGGSIKVDVEKNEETKSGELVLIINDKKIIKKSDKKNKDLILH